MSIKKIDTPCIGICSTIYGDEICRGCKRNYQEVINWNKFSTQQKDRVLQRLWQQIIEACQDKITITDEKQLSAQCDKYNIRYSHQQNPLCWAFYLLQEGHSKIQSIEKYGFKITVPHTSLTKLYQQIDQQILDGISKVEQSDFVAKNSRR